MGLGPTATVGFQDEDGNWTPVTPSRALPVRGTGGDGGGGGGVTGLNGVTGLWQGTQAQYDAITTKNPNVVYVVKVS